MANQGGTNGHPPESPGDFLPRNTNVPYQRIVTFALIGIGLILVLVLLSITKNAYTEWLWYDSLGYRSVYSKGLFTKVWLFFAGAGVFSTIFLAHIFLAQRFARRDEPAVLPPETIELIRGFTRLGIVVATIMLALIMGSVSAGQWENFLRFVNTAPFVDSQGMLIAEPLNGHNPSFYVFTLPLLRFVQTWLLGSTIVSILGVIAIYGVGYSLRGFNWTFSRSVKIHVASLFGLLALLVAWSYWFDIKELVLSSRGLGGSLFGAGYTDATAKLLALKVMMGITTLVAVAAIASAFRKGVTLPVASFGVWFAGVIVVLVIIPAGVQRFQVEPSELAKETPYIERNVAFTREAYELDDIEVTHFPTSEKLPGDEIIQNPALIDNIRLWDHRPLRDTLNQIQFFRPYYEFLDVDVDRYDLGSGPRQVMLSSREMSSERLPDEAQSWVAQRLQYTHGYGFTMSPVNQFTPEGRPEFFVKDLPPQGALEIDRPEIYYGEKSDRYVLVNTNTEEFDYPTEQDVPVFTKYQGAGGVEMSSFLRRLAFAWRLSDFNLLISGEITSESRLMMLRQVQDRVGHIAPFLHLDPDPYLVAADGKLWWIQDTYTTTGRFPYSQPFGGVQESSESFNYIRNSVKVVIDAYNGHVDFYVMEPDDAIVSTYSNMYPGLFKPFDQMPPSLRDHIRYPEGLFNVQEAMFRTYHLTDPRGIFTREDIWSRPSEIFYDSPQPMEAYYVTMPLPGEKEPEFLLLAPFTPLGKPNLVAWLAARNDGDDYGKLVAYTFSKDKQVDGPSQVEARINNDPLISQQFTLWGQQGSEIIRGNLLVIPVGESIMYVEPVYLQASTLKFPELKRVIVSIGANSPAMEKTLERAVKVALGKADPSPPLGGLSIMGSEQVDSAPKLKPRESVESGGELADPDLDKLVRQLEDILAQFRQLQEQR